MAGDGDIILRRILTAGHCDQGALVPVQRAGEETGGRLTGDVAGRGEQDGELGGVREVQGHCQVVQPD